MHTITGKLNNPAQQFQAGESTGFSIGLGVKYKDPKTKADEWTNYSAVIFAKSPNQIQFYQNVLVKGAIVSVGAEQLKIDVYEGQNGQRLSIDMLNAKLTYAFNPNNQPAQQPAQQQAPQNYQQPQQQAPRQQTPQQQRPQNNQPAPSNYAQVPHAQQAQQQAPTIDTLSDDIPW